MPGAAAKAVAASENTNTIGARIFAICEIAFFIVISLIAALLVAGVAVGVTPGHTVADMHLSHHSTEVFGVVGKVIKGGRVKVKHAARRVQRLRASSGSASGVAGIPNHVVGFSAAQRDRVCPIFSVVSCLVSQELGVPADDVHWNP